MKRVFATTLLAGGLSLLAVGCSSTGASGPAVSEEKMAELKAAAAKNDPDAMYDLGDAYSKNKDYANAKMWYDKAKAAYEAMQK